MSFYFFITFLYIYHILGLQGDRIEEADTPFEPLFFILFLFIYYIFGLLGDRIEEADTPFEPLFFILFLFIYYIFGLLGDRIEEAVTPLELFHLGLPELNVGVLEKRQKKRIFFAECERIPRPKGGYLRSKSQ